MSTNIPKGGCRPGSSQYARQDEQALERMYELVVRDGQSRATAARTAAVALKLPGTNPEERIRKKFDRCRPQIEAKIAARSRPQEPQTRAPRLGPIWEQARQTAEALKTPEGKALVEHARWVAENKALVREAAARARSARKP